MLNVNSMPKQAWWESESVFFLQQLQDSSTYRTTSLLEGSVACSSVLRNSGMLRDVQFTTWDLPILLLHAQQVVSNLQLEIDAAMNSTLMHKCPRVQISVELAAAAVEWTAVIQVVAAAVPPALQFAKQFASRALSGTCSLWHFQLAVMVYSM